MTRTTDGAILRCTADSKQADLKELRTEITVNAPADVVWATLIDLDSFHGGEDSQHYLNYRPVLL